MKPVAITALLSAALMVSTLQAKWARMPSMEKKPVGMNTVMSGTTVLAAPGIGQADSLVLGDPLKPVKLPNGKSEAVLRFAKPSVVETISFVSDGIEGKVAMSISTDGKLWSPLDNASFAMTDRMVRLQANTAQGKYLRLQFDLLRGGLIRGFQVIGQDSDANYKVTQNEQGTGAPVNFAAGYGGGRLLYISPELFGNRTEATRSNQLEFPESDEKYRTAVYDLGQVRTLNEFGSVHSQRPVRFSVYAFDTLPEKEDWRGRLAFDPTVFDTLEPVARAEDSRGTGSLTARPSKSVRSRYIALRWEPDFNPPAFSAYSVTITGAASVAFTGSGVTVTTEQDADGNIVAKVNVEGGNNLTITIDSKGNVIVTGSGAADGATGPQIDVKDENGIPIPGGAGAPSNIGISLPGSPSS